MNLSGLNLWRRIGLWVLMICAGLLSYGFGLYQGSAFRMQRTIASEGRMVPVIIESNAGTMDVLKVKDASEPTPMPSKPSSSTSNNRNNIQNLKSPTKQH